MMLAPPGWQTAMCRPAHPPASSPSRSYGRPLQPLEVAFTETGAPAREALKVEIEAFKFSANTTHLRDKATMIVGKMLDDKQTGLYLAVTTRTE